MKKFFQILYEFFTICAIVAICYVVYMWLTGKL